MKVLDLDMDYFMTSVAINIDESTEDRLDEEYYHDEVWSEQQVKNFLENNLGLSTAHKLKGRVVKGHNESLYFWQELLGSGQLEAPFEVIHVDSHADLGLGYGSYVHITNEMLRYPVEERPNHSQYVGCKGDLKDIGIGDYLLFAVAYRWIDRLVYCSNPHGSSDDYLWTTIKDFEEPFSRGNTVMMSIQLLHNPDRKEPDYSDEEEKRQYLETSIKEPEVPFVVIPTVEGVNYEGDFDFVVMAQSPNYTPQSADFIMDVFRKYIEEI